MDNVCQKGHRHHTAEGAQWCNEQHATLDEPAYVPPRGDEPDTTGILGGIMAETIMDTPSMPDSGGTEFGGFGGGESGGAGGGGGNDAGSW